MTVIDFSLPALNRAYTLDVSGGLSAEAPVTFDVSATAIYYIKKTTLRNVFRFESDSFDVEDISSSDVKYYVYMNTWPSDASLNPAHAYTKPSGGKLLEDSLDIPNNKNLVKHDFVRYLAKHLFNTPYGVDLFNNEDALLTDIATKGRAAKDAIMNVLNTVNQVNAAGGTTPNKYSTNDLSNNTNICRELMLQIANKAPARFYGADISGIQSVPIEIGDTINFKLSISAALNQADLTGRGNFDVRVYKISLIVTDPDVLSLNVAPVDVSNIDKLDYIPNN
jgi:hypothetical protein